MVERLRKRGAVIGIVIIVPIMLLVSIVGSVTSQISVVLVGGEEEGSTGGGSTITVSLNLSPDVARYREPVLAEAKKYGMEAYINLFLAVIMQESGGQGGDIFRLPNPLDCRQIHLIRRGALNKE